MQDGAAASQARRSSWRWPQLDENAVNMTVTIVVALSATYVALCIKTVAMGGGIFGFADFHALWVSGVLAHGGQPLTNYDSNALHQAQVALGIDDHHLNPFPYPPTLLLLLAPFGALPLPVAFGLFMIATAAAFWAAMTFGRLDQWRWHLGALAAPACGITLISGQSGFLTGALMIGGLRLVETRPALAGALFGLLTSKPQLGVLVPIALVAAGSWRAIASAAVAALALALASSLAFGAGVWLAWAHQLREYADQYPVVLNLMPTVFAGLTLAGAPKIAALALQAAMFVVVAATIAEAAAREGFSPRTRSLVVVGTFLATPHAFNYDMPMTAAAIGAFLIARRQLGRALSLFETAALIAGFMLPFLVLAFRNVAAPYFWMALAALFLTLMRREAWPAR